MSLGRPVGPRFAGACWCCWGSRTAINQPGHLDWAAAECAKLIVDKHKPRAHSLVIEAHTVGARGAQGRFSPGFLPREFNEGVRGPWTVSGPVPASAETTNPVFRSV